MKRDTQEQTYISETTGRCVFILSPVINYLILNTGILIFWTWKRVTKRYQCCSCACCLGCCYRIFNVL